MPGSGNIFSTLGNAMSAPNMAPWWGLLLGNSGSAQNQMFSQGMQGLQQQNQFDDRMAYQQQQDAIDNRMKESKFAAQMKALEEERLARQQAMQQEREIGKAIAQQMNVSEDMGYLIAKSLQGKDRLKAMGFDQFADPMKPWSPAGQEQGDIQAGRLDPEFLQQRREGSRASTNVTVNNASELPTWAGKALTEAHEKATSAIRDTQAISEATRLIDEGLRTGFAPQTRQELARAASTLGLPVNDDLINNTDVFVSQVGRRVGEVISAFGAGTGLSDADRQYAERIAGGDLRMDSAALKRLLKIAERANQNVIKDYEERTAPLFEADPKLGSLYSLPRLPEPESAGPEIIPFSDFF